MAAPSVFRAGVEESVSVTIFNAKAETRVQVQLSVKGQTVSHSHGSVLGEYLFFVVVFFVCFLKKNIFTKALRFASG